MSDKKPIYSMTGFGRGAFALGATQLSVECKSLNSRFLEINCKLPRIYSSLEQEIRQIVQSCISRGRIELLASRKSDATVTEEVAGKQLAILSEHKRRLTELECQYSSLGITIDNKQRFEIARQLLSSTSVNSEEDALSEEEISALKQTVVTALEQLQKQRRDEGKRLYNDIVERLSQLSKDAKELSVKAAEVPKLLRERVSERIKTSLASVTAVDEARLLQEIVLLVDKADVTEELVRLASHIQLFHDTFETGGLVGKRLDFVCQEIFRELNTLGGKSASAEMQAIVVNCKVELERIREQVQNFE